MFLPLSIGTSSKRISGVPVIYEFQIAEVVLAFPEDRGNVCISQEEEMFQGCICLVPGFQLGLFCCHQWLWYRIFGTVIVPPCWTVLPPLWAELAVDCDFFLTDVLKKHLFSLLILNSSGDWGSSWSECAGTKTDTTPLSCSGQWNSYLPCSRS